MQPPFVMGNWKLNGNKKMVNDFTKKLHGNLRNMGACTVAIAPPVMYLDIAKHSLMGSPIAIGAQNVDIHLSGAFTGEVSAEMLKDIGATYIIIGHSERRFYHKENNEYIAKKFSVLKQAGLIPVLCIGESEEDNKTGKTEMICAHQLDAVLNTLGIKAFENTVIAYEPIWAIGTGKSAHPDQVQGVHQFIRNYIGHYDSSLKEKVIIQYGGSVNPNNAAEFFSKRDIDGALVGGASLEADSFSEIVKAAILAKKRQ